MICKVCGRTIANEDANFCEYCGASFREMKQAQDGASSYQTVPPMGVNSQQGQMYQQSQPNWQGQSSAQNSYQQQQGQRQQNVQAGENKQPISFLNWLGTMLLPYIPFVGSLTYIVMLFVWAFGKDSNPTKKNWARAKLIVTAIGIVAFIILVAYVTGEVLSSGMTLNDYVNTTYY